MKVLANDGISASGIAKLEAAGIIIHTEFIPQDQLISKINEIGYVGILVRSATKVRQDIIDACPDLKFIGRGGVGMDNIDVQYGRDKGLDVFNTPAASSQSVAELVMAHLYSLARNTFDSNREMPAKGASEFKVLKKKYAKGSELRGKTLGIIGFGRIGKSTATYALGAGMKVLAHDRGSSDGAVQWNIEGAGVVNVNVPMVSFEEIISTSDFISIHVPKQENGSAVITKNEISQMKDGVCLINAARGGVINEHDLIEALNTGKVKFAALDVFENEPTPREDLLKHEKLASTPHVGAATSEAQDRIGVELADQILSILQPA
ncbi:MAG: D-2-hydroxyacid dehydrogenase [Flavobacteriales bacterium]